VIKPVVNGLTFLINPSINGVSKQVLTISLEALLFKMLAIKLNQKFYQTVQVKNNYSLHYKENKILIFQFRITDLKKKSK
jgi:ribosomal protein L21